MKKGCRKKKYQGIYTSEAYHLRASSVTKDANLKTRYTWMTANCVQKQADVHMQEKV